MDVRENQLHFVIATKVWRSVAAKFLDRATLPYLAGSYSGYMASRRGDGRMPKEHYNLR